MKLSVSTLLSMIAFFFSVCALAWRPYYDKLSENPMQYDLPNKDSQIEFEFLVNVTPGEKVNLGEIKLTAGKTSALVTCSLVTNAITFPENNKGLKWTYSKTHSESMQAYGKVTDAKQKETGNYSSDRVVIAFEEGTRTFRSVSVPGEILYNSNTGNYYRLTESQFEESYSTSVAVAIKCDKHTIEDVLHADGRKFVGGLSPFLKLDELIQAVEKKGLVKVTIVP